MENEYFTIRELKRRAELVVKESSFNVSEFARSINLSRQYVYDCLKFDETNQTSGISVVMTILHRAGIKIDTENLYVKIYHD